MLQTERHAGSGGWPATQPRIASVQMNARNALRHVLPRMPGIADISVATFVLTKVMKDALACTNPARDGQLDIVPAARFMQPAQDMVAAVPQ